ncbi:MAG: homocysteine S-methyltransferase family protein, partial [Ignavibacteria bacterium]|nr:homocysteine S-methyltransferase family protein [Ignavibacteria bacterium]
TFGANSIRLKMYGLESKTVEINKRAVELARGLVEENNLVALSVGPLGSLIEPLGEITHEQAFDAFREQAKGADEADFINIETVQSLDEAEIAVNAFRSVLNLPISISITYHKTPNGYFTMMGESIKDTIDRVSTWDIQVIGSNCGEGFLQLVEILTEMKSLTNLPLLAKPNAGLPIIKDGIQIYTEEPQHITDKIETLFGLGVRIVGGCCGTTSAHIKEIKKVADRINSI